MADEPTSKCNVGGGAGPSSPSAALPSWAILLWSPHWGLAKTCQICSKVWGFPWSSWYFSSFLSHMSSLHLVCRYSLPILAFLPLQALSLPPKLASCISSSSQHVFPGDPCSTSVLLLNEGPCIAIFTGPHTLGRQPCQGFSEINVNLTTGTQQSSRWWWRWWGFCKIALRTRTPKF